MQKSKKKSKKINLLLIIILISMFIVIPNLLISIQRYSEIPIDEKNPNEIINTRPPQASPVYYEATAGIAFSVYVSGDYAYLADHSSGLAIIDVSDPTNPGTPV
jgi:flagellar basal body-associated protein FliL